MTESTIDNTSKKVKKTKTEKTKEQVAEEIAKLRERIAKKEKEYAKKTEAERAKMIDDFFSKIKKLTGIEEENFNEWANIIETWQTIAQAMCKITEGNPNAEEMQKIALDWVAEMESKKIFFKLKGNNQLLNF